MTKEVKNIDDQEEELFEHYNFIADNGQEKLRIDKFLMDRIANTSRNKIQIAEWFLDYASYVILERAGKR